MGRSRIFILAVAGLIALLITVQAPDARASALVVLHLRFGLLASGVSGVSGSGPYVGFTNTSDRFVLINDRTGKRIPTPTDCDAGVVGNPWVGLYCSSSLGSYEAINARTGKVRQLPCAVVCGQNYYFQNLVAVGARWFEVEVEPHEPCGDGIHSTCGPTTFAFYSTRNGKLGVPNLTNSEMIDLNSPTLTRRLCRPLLEPAGDAPPLRFYGPFAVAQEENGSVDLQRCGTHLDIPLVTEPPGTEGLVFGSANAVVLFPSCPTACAPPVGSGLFLPSLRPFTFGVPSGLGLLGSTPPAAYLGPRHIYLVDPQGARIWAAPFPSKPPGPAQH